MTDQELRDVLYTKFGAYSKRAHHILNTAFRNDSQNLQQLVHDSGYSFRFVREIMYTMDGHISLNNHHFLMSDHLKNILNLEATHSRVDLETLLASITSIVRNFTKHNPDLDHISALPETCYKRAQFLIDHFDIETCHILFVGDHDLSSISLALLAKHLNLNYHIYVVDIDDHVLSYIQEISHEYGLSIAVSHADFRFSMPKMYYGKMDVVFTDPPYTPEGMGVFLNRSIQCLKNNPYSTLCISYKSAEMSTTLGVSVQKEMLKRNLYISELIPNFNHYDAAEALGYRSDLYVCRLTPASIKYMENPEYTYHIYTHGAQAVESKRQYIEWANHLNHIEKTRNHKLTTIHLIESGQSIPYKGTVHINTIKLRRFIDLKIDGKLNINKEGVVIFDCTGFSESYQFRPLLLCGLNEYFCLFTKDQMWRLQTCDIISFINYGYEIELLSDDGDVCLYRFKQKLNMTNKNDKLFLFMLLNARSGLKNSFVKAITTTKKMTKNEARHLFDSFLVADDKQLLFNSPQHDIIKLSDGLRSLQL